MSSPGPKRTVSDSRIVQAIRDHPDPVVKSKELAEQLPLGATRITQILGDLEDDGLVESKQIGSGHGWWVTDCDLQ